MRKREFYRDGRNCEGHSRRDCIALGLGTLLGGGLVHALRARGVSAEGAKPDPSAKPKVNTKCVLVWLDGGPTHYETFDPKPDAPKEIRGIYGTIPTKQPGVHFSKHMKQLAAISDKLAIVRSIRHNHGNHGAGNHYMMTGAPTRIPVGCGAFVSFHPSLGSVTAKERGAPDGLPPYFSMPSMSRSGGPNFLGARYAPFVVSNNPNSGGFRVRDVAPIERSDQVASEECQHRYRRQKESKLPTSISHPTAIVPDRSAIDRLSTPLWDRGIVLRKNRSTRRTITTGN